MTKQWKFLIGTYDRICVISELFSINDNHNSIENSSSSDYNGPC